MKISKLEIKNIRLIEKADIEFNKSVIGFWGDIKQGKTTILFCIKILFGASVPAELIQHGKNEGSICLRLENGKISRSFYIDKNKKTKARPLSAVINNEKISADELKKMFNPFQFDESFLKTMNRAARDRFFVDLFDIDTTQLDHEINVCEKTASDTRKEIKACGNPLQGVDEVKAPDFSLLDLQKVNEEDKLAELLTVNIAANNEKKQTSETEYQKNIVLWQENEAAARKKVDDWNKLQNKRDTNIQNAQSELFKIQTANENLKKIFPDLEIRLYENAIQEAIDEMKEPEQRQTVKPTTPPTPEKLKLPDVNPNRDRLNEILQKINDAKLQQKDFEIYNDKVDLQKQKEISQDYLSGVELALRNLRKDKIAKLAEYGKEIDGLIFDENGSFKFKGITNGNLSDSDMIELGSLLSTLYPDSLIDAELLDRGESLGLTGSKAYSKIEALIKLAEKQQKTKIVTIVGDVPAEVPEDIGVFVVENGKITEI